MTPIEILALIGAWFITALILGTLHKLLSSLP